MAFRKRIVILDNAELLAVGVFSLLSQLDSLEVIGVTLGVVGDIDQIYAFKPDVIVIDEAIVAEHIDVYRTLLKNYGHQIRIIVLHPQKNQLDICDKQIVFVEGLNDFLDLI